MQVSPFWTGLFRASWYTQCCCFYCQHDAACFHCTSALLQAFDASQELAMAGLSMTVPMTVLIQWYGRRTECNGTGSASMSNGHTVKLELPSRGSFHKLACRLREPHLAIP